MSKRKPAKSRTTARRPLVGLAGRINAAHRKCKQSLQAGAEYAVEAGRLLIEAKAKVPPKGWLRWLERHCEFPERMAQRYMRLARELPEALRADPTRVSELSQRAALELLADRDREEAGRPAPEPDGPKRMEWRAVPVSSPPVAEPVTQTVRIYDAAAGPPGDPDEAPPPPPPSWTGRTGCRHRSAGPIPRRNTSSWPRNFGGGSAGRGTCSASSPAATRSRRRRTALGRSGPCGAWPSRSLT